MKAKITKTAVDRMAPGDVLHDAELAGFQARRRADGVTYSVLRAVDGRKVRVTIGRHGTFTPDKARKEARRLLMAMAAGTDPRTRKGALLAEIAPEFLAHIEAKRAPGTHREYKSHFDDVLLPRFGKLPLNKITTGELRKLHQDMKGTPTLANRVLATESSLFGWAQSNDPSTPLPNPATARLVERYKERKREWRGKPEQMAKLARVLRDYEAAGRWSPFAIGAIWLYLATGQRRDSIRTMRWEHVDWETGIVTLHVKRRGMIPVEFNDAAIAILRKLRALPDDGNPHVIRGTVEGEPYKNVQDVWEQVRADAGLDGVRLHDLRHHVGSLVADNYQVATVARVLGNTPNAAMRYIHADEGAARQASAGVGKAVARLMGPGVKAGKRKRASRAPTVSR
jgi:integrase